MAEYFVQEGASGSKDGRDPNGFDLTAGSYDDTGHGDGNYRLSSTGSFSSYTFGEDDWIYLSGGAGITPGLYEIASKVSNDVILLTSSAGSDSTSDVTSSDGPMTMEEACSVPPAAGDTVWIKADATYDTKDSVGNAVMYIRAEGSATNHTFTTYEGYKTNPGDGGIITIDANPASQYTYGIFSSTSHDYICLKNMEVKGASSHGISLNAGSYCALKFISSHNNGSYGILGNDYSSVFCCITYDNGSIGFGFDVACNMVANIAYGNGHRGVAHRGGLASVYNLSYENDDSQVFTSGTAKATVVACTVDGGGLEVGITSIGGRSTVYNNIMYDCTTGLTSTVDYDRVIPLGNNCYKDNTTDVSNFLPVSAGDGVGDRGDVSEPTNLFTDAATNDYTLHTSSGAKNKGMDANFVLNFWNDYNEGAGDNPPSE